MIRLQVRCQGRLRPADYQDGCAERNEHPEKDPETERAAPEREHIVVVIHTNTSEVID
jgi:hypothetical protein